MEVGILEEIMESQPVGPFPVTDPLDTRDGGFESEKNCTVIRSIVGIVYLPIADCIARSPSEGNVNTGRSIGPTLGGSVTSILYCKPVFKNQVFQTISSFILVWAE